MSILKPWQTPLFHKKEKGTDRSLFERCLLNVVSSAQNAPYQKTQWARGLATSIWQDFLSPCCLICSFLILWKIKANIFKTKLFQQVYSTGNACYCWSSVNPIFKEAVYYSDKISTINIKTAISPNFQAFMTVVSKYNWLTILFGIFSRLFRKMKLWAPPMCWQNVKTCEFWRYLWTAVAKLAWNAVGIEPILREADPANNISALNTDFTVNRGNWEGSVFW